MTALVEFRTVRSAFAGVASCLILVIGCAAPLDSIAQSATVQKDLIGTWTMTEKSSDPLYFSCCQGPSTDIPFTPKYRKIRDAFARLPFGSDQAKSIGNQAHCISPGVPGTFTHPLLFEFLLTPGRVNLIYQNGTFRRIWTDGRSFPAKLRPSPQGYSIGHWDGNTLTVETRAISTTSEMFMSNPIHVTHQTKVTERFTVESDQLVQMQTTVVDPEILTGPYTYPQTFIKVPGYFEVECDNHDLGDHNQDVDLTPPKDD